MLYTHMPWLILKGIWGGILKQDVENEKKTCARHMGSGEVFEMLLVGISVVKVDLKTVEPNPYATLDLSSTARTCALYACKNHLPSAPMVAPCHMLIAPPASRSPSSSVRSCRLSCPLLDLFLFPTRFKSVLCQKAKYVIRGKE